MIRAAAAVDQTGDAISITAKPVGTVARIWAQKVEVMEMPAAVLTEEGANRKRVAMTATDRSSRRKAVKYLGGYCACSQMTELPPRSRRDRSGACSDGDTELGSDRSSVAWSSIYVCIHVCIWLGETL